MFCINKLFTYISSIPFQKTLQKKDFSFKSESKGLPSNQNKQKLCSDTEKLASSIFELHDIKHFQELFNDSFCKERFVRHTSTSNQDREVISELLIGMHPDQATESIVDMALKYQKPFAIVPCCVFAQENPHRRLKDKK